MLLSWLISEAAIHFSRTERPAGAPSTDTCQKWLKQAVLISWSEHALTAIDCMELTAVIV